MKDSIAITAIWIPEYDRDIQKFKTPLGNQLGPKSSWLDVSEINNLAYRKIDIPGLDGENIKDYMSTVAGNNYIQSYVCAATFFDYVDDNPFNISLSLMQTLSKRSFWLWPIHLFWLPLPTTNNQNIRKRYPEDAVPGRWLGYPPRTDLE
jgi:hypothetical protein